MSAHRGECSALLLLVALLAAQFPWQALPTDQQFAGWTAGQGLFGAFLLVLVWARYPEWEMRAAAVLAFACQGLTAWCSIKWLIQPWIPTGRDRCSAAFDFPVGMLVAALAMVLAWRFYRGGRHVG